jgi:hypothetical protein
MAVPRMYSSESYAVDDEPDGLYDTPLLWTLNSAQKVIDPTSFTFLISESYSHR